MMKYICFLLLIFIDLTFAIDISSCGKAKECISNPPNCNVTKSSCLVFTYAWKQSSQTFNMEISGSSGNEKQYSAIAFALQPEMKNADLYYCTGKDLKSGVIQQQYETPETLGSLPKNVTIHKTQTVDGVAYCSFSRYINVTKTVSGNLVDFNLFTNKYYLLQAFGNVTNGNLQQHAGENVGRFSSGPYNFTMNSSEVSTTTVPDTTTAPDTTTTSSNNSIDAECGKTKGCFKNPSSCRGGAASCMFLSWIYDSKLNAFDFEIVGGSTDQYAAVAFGTTNKMQDADLYYCTKSKFYSGAIQLQDKSPFEFNSLPNSIDKVSVQIVDGVLRCSFRRPAAVSKPISNGVNYDFNLAKEDYYLLYAFGTPQKNGSLTYHHDTRTLTKSRLNFTRVTKSNGSSSIDINLVKVHASLMLIAWMSCVSIGVLVSRHCKQLWRTRSFSSHKLWFQFHRFLMLIGLGCTIVGFIVIFVAKKEYSHGAGAHPILGIIVTLLVIVNPIMATCRPRPETKSRPLFNWFHRYVGTWSRILSVAAMFLGLHLPLLNLPYYLTYLMAGFVALHTVFEIVLELISARYGHIAGYQSKDQDDCEDDHSSLLNMPLPGDFIKKLVLGVYILANLGILITLITSIVKN